MYYIYMYYIVLYVFHFVSHYRNCIILFKLFDSTVKQKTAWNFNTFAGLWSAKRMAKAGNVGTLPITSSTRPVARHSTKEIGREMISAMKFWRPKFLPRLLQLCVCLGSEISAGRRPPNFASKRPQGAERPASLALYLEVWLVPLFLGKHGRSWKHMKALNIPCLKAPRNARSIFLRQILSPKAAEVKSSNLQLALFKRSERSFILYHPVSCWKSEVLKRKEVFLVAQNCTTFGDSCGFTFQKRPVGPLLWLRLGPPRVQVLLGGQCHEVQEAGTQVGLEVFFWPTVFYSQKKKKKH